VNTDPESTSPQPALPSLRWRPSARRLLFIYGAFFLAWSVVLVGSISWQTTQYLDRVVGEILEQRVHYLASIAPAQLPAMLAATNQLDLRGVMFFGLFDANGAYRSGNLDRLPEGLPSDGVIRALPKGLRATDGPHDVRALGVALRLDSGDVLVLARTTGVADRIGAMTRSALGWALSLLLIPGLIGACSAAGRCAACAGSNPPSRRSCAAISARACPSRRSATNSTCSRRSSTACSMRSSACSARSRA